MDSWIKMYSQWLYEIVTAIPFSQMKKLRLRGAIQLAKIAYADMHMGGQDDICDPNDLSDLEEFKFEVPTI